MNRPKGTFYFKALFRYKNRPSAWELSFNYYASLKQAKEHLYATDIDVLWPAELIDRECVYVPSEEELNEENA